jgi:trans-aconitate methyltransferase
MKKNESINELIKLYAGQGSLVKFYVQARSLLLNLNYYAEAFSNAGTIVDIGCGYGVLANYLSLTLPNNDIVGIDIDYKRINSATMTIGQRANITFQIADVTHCSLPDCIGIVMTDFLHHVYPSEQRKILESAFLSLRKGGVLLIAEADSGAKPIYRYWASYLSDRFLYPASKSYFRKSKDWEDILSGLGFKVITVKERNPIIARIMFCCRK